MTQPSNESRISNLEKEAMSLGARIEELATDTDNNFRALRQEMKDGFLEIGTLFDRNFERLDDIETDISIIKATMATKDDIARLEGLIMQLLQQKSGE
jgi:ABC-type enterochelin transport system substrate-binding protein